MKTLGAITGCFFNVWMALSLMSCASAPTQKDKTGAKQAEPTDLYVKPDHTTVYIVLL